MESFCSICALPYRLRKDGTVRAHKRLVLAYTYGARDRREPCPGSLVPPRLG